jgi:hypothetical protein
VKQAASRAKRRVTRRYIPEGKLFINKLSHIKKEAQNIHCNFAHRMRFDVLLPQTQFYFCKSKSYLKRSTATS